jgi:hypothetical protein
LALRILPLPSHFVNVRPGAGHKYDLSVGPSRTRPTP